MAADCLQWGGRWAAELPLAPRPRRATFLHDGQQHRYTRHRYHYTWLNERAVEVSLAAAQLARHDPSRVLELGNVMRHYQPVRHPCAAGGGSRRVRGCNARGRAVGERRPRPRSAAGAVRHPGVRVDLLVYDEDDRWYVPWPVALAGLLIAVLLASGGAYLAARSSEPQPRGTPLSGLPSPEAATGPLPAGTTAPEAEDSSTCREGLRQADVVLERAARLDQALAEHTRVMEDLLADRLSRDEALDQTLPVLTIAATDRRLFAEELAAYSATRSACPD